MKRWRTMNERVGIQIHEGDNGPGVWVYVCGDRNRAGRNDRPGFLLRRSAHAVAPLNVCPLRTRPFKKFTPIRRADLLDFR
jgi:hypothetical protein